MPHVCQDRALDPLNSSRVRHPVDSGATRGRPVETTAAAPHPVDGCGAVSENAVGVTWGTLRVLPGGAGSASGAA